MTPLLRLPLAPAPRRNRRAWPALPLALALLGPLAATAQDDPARLYAGGQLGVSHLSGWPARVDFGNGVAMQGRLGLADGVQAGAFIGRQRGPQRWELEAVVGQQALSRIELGPQQADAGGSARYQALLVNAVRQMTWTDRWSGYAGLGLGWGRVTLPAAGFGAAGCRCFAAASGSGAVVQARVGLEAVVDGDHKAYVQLGALRLPGASGGNGPAVSYPRRDVLSLTVGYRRTF